jgi:hypothetical protein
MPQVLISIQIREVLVRTDTHTRKTYQPCTPAIATALFLLTLRQFSFERQQNILLVGRGQHRIIPIQKHNKTQTEIQNNED